MPGRVFAELNRSLDCPVFRYRPLRKFLLQYSSTRGSSARQAASASPWRHRVSIVAPASNVKRAGLGSRLRGAAQCRISARSISIRFSNRISTLPDRWSDVRANWKTCLCATMCERSCALAVDMARTICSKNLISKKIKAHPKIFVGYSDITTLLTYFADAAGLVTFHGPMAAKDWAHDGGVDLASWQAALSGYAAWDVPLNADVSGLVEGEAEGILYGGCLSILVASLGTPYEIKTAGTILFLEDVAAKPFQIDRMLMQLKLAGHFDNVRGIVFGEMLDCVQTANQGYTLQDVVTRIVGDLGVPVAYGVRSGHVTSREHHAAVRGASETIGEQRQAGVEDSGIRGDAVDRRRSVSFGAAVRFRLAENERRKTHSPDRNLRHCDGLAGGNAEAARISCYRLRRRSLSAHVGFSCAIGHPRCAALRREES